MKKEIFENNSKGWVIGGSTHEMVTKEEKWKNLFTLVMELKENFCQKVKKEYSCVANCQHFFSSTINHPLLFNHDSLVVVGWHLLGCTWVAAKTLLSCINGDRDERVHRVVRM